MPALVEGERTDPLGQRGHQLTEAPTRIQPAVEQHNRNAIGIALLDIGQLKSIPKHGQMHHVGIVSTAGAIPPEPRPEGGRVAAGLAAYPPGRPARVRGWRATWLLPQPPEQA